MKIAFFILLSQSCHMVGWFKPRNELENWDVSLTNQTFSGSAKGKLQDCLNRSISFFTRWTPQTNLRTYRGLMRSRVVNWSREFWNLLVTNLRREQKFSTQLLLAEMMSNHANKTFHLCLLCGFNREWFANSFSALAFFFGIHDRWFAFATN